MHLKECKTSLTTEEWDTLVETSEGYSGSDIRAWVMGALYQPIKDMQTTIFWKMTSG